MDDRTMLQLAAKAAGYTIIAWSGDGTLPYIKMEHGEIPWNPNDNDGDEARLEAALSLSVNWDEYGVTVGGTISSDGDVWGGEFEPYHSHPDKQSARRLAGVRAAAEIGKAKQEG